MSPQPTRQASNDTARACIRLVLAMFTAFALIGCVSYRVVGEMQGSGGVAVKAYGEGLRIGDYVWITFADGRQDGLTLSAVEPDSLSGALDSTGEHAQYQRQAMTRVEVRQRNVRGTVGLGIAGGLLYIFLFSLFCC
jgi:hypothetical protein